MSAAPGGSPDAQVVARVWARELGEEASAPQDHRRAARGDWRRLTVDVAKRCRLGRASRVVWPLSLDLRVHETTQSRHSGNRIFWRAGSCVGCGGGVPCGLRFLTHYFGAPLN